MAANISQERLVRILLIDNDPDFGHTIERYLRWNNYECTVLSDSMTGLAAILEERFDVVVLNAEMPGFDDDIIDFIAIHGTLNEQKIIILKSESLPNKKVKELHKKGIHFCLDKSVSPQDLLSTIKSSNSFAAILKQKINTRFSN